MTPSDVLHDHRWDEHRPRPHRRLDTVALFARTVARLRPAQVGHRIRLRTLRAAERRWPEVVTRSVNPPAGVTPGWPKVFGPLDASLEHGDGAEIALGRFRFLGEERTLGEPADWNQAAASRLWRFHLHYVLGAGAPPHAPGLCVGKAVIRSPVAVMACFDRPGMRRRLVPVCGLAPGLGAVRRV
jgi:hypothetical protein